MIYLKDGLFTGSHFVLPQKNKRKERENVRLHIPGFTLTCFGCFISVTPGPFVGSSLYTDLQFALFSCEMVVLVPVYYIPLEQEGPYAL